MNNIIQITIDQDRLQLRLVQVILSYKLLYKLLSYIASLR